MRHPDSSMWQRSSVARVTWLLFAGYAWVFLGCALASGQDAVVAAAVAAPGLLTCVPIVATVAAVAAEDNTWAEPPPKRSRVADGWLARFTAGYKSNFATEDRRSSNGGREESRKKWDAEKAGAWIYR